MARPLAPEDKLQSKRHPKTVGEIDTFITMLQTACDDENVYERLERLLSMPDEKRQAVVHAWVNDLPIANGAMACRRDPRR